MRRKKEEREKGDESIIGSGDFVTGILKKGVESFEMQSEETSSLDLEIDTVTKHMGVTVEDLKPVEWRRYRLSEAVERREKTQDTAVDVRKQEAWGIAGSAAQLLRKEFGAKKIVVFGSLAHEKGFGLWSDIDLGALGIPPEKFYSAVAAVIGLSSFFKIDLVDVAECSTALQKVIEEEGIEV